LELGKRSKRKISYSLNLWDKDAAILPLALEKTIELMKIIFSTEQEQFFQLQTTIPQNGLKNGKKVTKK
jgi:hypothetical protein